MSNPKTVSQLQEHLDAGFAWRLKEIGTLKVAIKSPSMLAASTIIRAGIPLLYAHWEGFVKQASQDYLSFVASQRLHYQELASCFVVFGAKKHLENILNAKRASANIEAVEFFRQCSEVRANLSLSNAIDTRANLSSDVFSNIATSLGVSLTPYDCHFHLIDESLLARRNKIAHGEYLELNADDFKSLADQIMQLLRMYKTDLENMASLGTFRVSSAAN